MTSSEIESTRLAELTPLQLEILEILWAEEEATAAEVHSRLEPTTGLSRNTIGTVITRLERYGILDHRSAGREFVYRAKVTKEEVRRSKTSRLLRNVFAGSVPALVSYALEEGVFEPGDVEQVRALIEEWEAGEEQEG